MANKALKVFIYLGSIAWLIYTLMTLDKTVESLSTGVITAIITLINMVINDLNND